MQKVDGSSPFIRSFKTRWKQRVFLSLWKGQPDSEGGDG